MATATPAAPSPSFAHAPATSPVDAAATAAVASAVASAVARAWATAAAASGAGAPPAPPAAAAGAAPPAPTSAAAPTTAASTPAASSERRLINQLLGHFKQTAEVRQYLRYYGSVEGSRAAIVRVTGDVLHDAGETGRVASALAFLHRIGLTPVVVHGAGLFTGRRSAEVAAAGARGDGETAAEAADRLLAAGREYMRSANAALVAALADGR